MTERCSDCRYYTPEVCRRYPPQVMKDDSPDWTTWSEWPMVDRDDWCGEFKSRWATELFGTEVKRYKRLDKR